MEGSAARHLPLGALNRLGVALGVGFAFAGLLYLQSCIHKARIYKLGFGFRGFRGLSGFRVMFWVRVVSQLALNPSLSDRGLATFAVSQNSAFAVSGLVAAPSGPKVTGTFWGRAPADSNVAMSMPNESSVR